MNVDLSRYHICSKSLFEIFYKKEFLHSNFLYSMRYPNNIEEVIPDTHAVLHCYYMIGNSSILYSEF